VSLKLRLALIFTLVVFVFLIFFCGVVYSIVERQQFFETSRLLDDHLQHEWTHLIHHRGHPDSGPGTFSDPEVVIEVFKNGKRISGLSPDFDPAVGNILSARSERVLEGERIEVVATMQPRKSLAYLSALRHVLVLGCLLSLIVILPLSLVCSGMMLKPFRILARTTTELNAKNLAFRFPAPKRRDEYGILISSFNSL